MNSHISNLPLHLVLVSNLKSRQHRDHGQPLKR